MIDRVTRGWDPRNLLYYLFSEGRYREHENPRLVATWDGQPEYWQPDRVGDGAFDFDLDPLATVFQAPAVAAGLPMTEPDPTTSPRSFYRDDAGRLKRKDGYVYHLVLRNDDADEVFSDARWGHIATEMMHRIGLARRDDPGAPRWCAVRHDDTGIHIMATLVRQDTGRPVSAPYNDWTKIRRVCEQMERRYGITSTASADGTAAPRPTRGEFEKAARFGRQPARYELRDAVAQAASVTSGFEEFVADLEGRGYLVQVRRMPSGDVCGYSVARQGDVNADGDPIRYSGRELSRDLSLPQLQRRWAQVQHGEQPDVAPHSEAWVRHTTTVVTRARSVLQDDPRQLDGIAHAAGEVMTSLDRGEGRLIYGAGARWDRAARAPRTPVPATEQAADDLRWMARGLSSARTASSNAAMVELAAALTALGLQIAAMQQQDGRMHQARAARQAARSVSQPSPSRPPAAPTPRRDRARHSDRLQPDSVSAGREASSRRGATSPRRRHGTPPQPPGSDRSRGPGRR